MLAVVGLMSALGLLEWTPAADFSGVDLLRLAALRLVSGFAVAFIEETFLRGAMHTAIERESGTRLAVLLTALLYAATHFLASQDRKSTRLNSSHSQISYAVFCLKKKNNKRR